jgi:hypothetical protein
MIKTETVHYIQLGTLVWVQNYKSKPKGKKSPWEQGHISQVDFRSSSYSHDFTRHYTNHSLSGAGYEVVLLRKNKDGRPLRLSVSASRISFTNPNEDPK